MSTSDLSSELRGNGDASRGASSMAEDLARRDQCCELLAAGTCDGVWDWDVPNQRVFFSPRWKEMRGLGADEVSDDVDEWASRVHPEDLPRVMAALQAHFEGKTRVFAEEYRARRKDGSWIWILDRGVALRDSEGHVTRMAGSESDITGRKQTEEALRRSEQRLRWALQAAGGGAWEWDLSTGVAWWSDEMYRLWGIEPGATMRLEGSLEVIDPRDRERVRTTVEEAIAAKGDYSCEFRIRHSVRGLRWMASQGRVVCNDDGVPTALLGLTTDITERKDALISLSASEARLRKLADAMPQLVWTGRADGTVDYYNSRVQEYAGIEQTSDGDWAWQPVLHDEDRDRTATAWQYAVATGAVYQCEHRVRMLDGSWRWHLSRAVPVRDETGAVLRWFGTATDIQDVKQAQEALQEADRHKNAFLATLAHELRNPLAPIRNAVEILKLKSPADGIERTARDIIDRQVTHMVRLIDDLLDLSRISRGTLQLQCGPVALGQILDQALEAARPHVERAGHELIVTRPEEEVRLQADAVRLAQVFGNLLNNACKFTPRGGVIRLSAKCERGADLVTVRVADNGVGIAREDIPRLFEMFSQVGVSTDKSQTGLGVGLALARNLVEMHGGSIRARSGGAGRGTELIVRLPILPLEAERGVPGQAKPSAAPSETAQRILVADDSEDIIDSLALLLDLNGFRVEKAHDGLEAVAAAERSLPDVILLDIGMPRLNGFDACKRIRALPGGDQVRIFALTGWGQDEDRRTAEAVGFDGLLVKPVDQAALLRVLALGR